MKYMQMIPEIGTILRGGSQLPFGTFPKIRPFWYPDPFPSSVNSETTSSWLAFLIILTCHLIFDIFSSHEDAMQILLQKIFEIALRKSAFSFPCSSPARRPS